MSINLTDEIEVKTKKGKLGAAKQIFLEGDTQTVENEIQDINSRHNDLNSKHESLSSTVSEHTNQIESNQNQITANKSTQDAKNTSLDANMAKLNTRDDQIIELVRGITATGGASVATTVTYDNTSSHLASATVQGAIDELQGSKIGKTSILQELGNAEDKVMSQKCVSQEIIQGGVYDVSAHNNSAVFESLKALLSSSNLNTLIPPSVRHGGMSIRFIQGSVPNSDNKYIQYRYICTATTGTPNPFLDTDNWTSGDGEFLTGEKISEVGIDDEPTVNSNNLVKSGGVCTDINNIRQGLFLSIKNSASIIKGSISRTGEFSARTDFSVYVIQVSAGDYVHIIGQTGYTVEYAMYSSFNGSTLNKNDVVELGEYYAGNRDFDKIVEVSHSGYFAMCSHKNATTQDILTLSSIAEIKNYVDEKTDNIPQIGYYICDDSSTTPAKEVTATNYVLTTGGEIKILFSERNTANNVTLNINGTGAKKIFYNGALVNNSNSWSSGEVVCLFYDGTQYQAYSIIGSSNEDVFDISKYWLTNGNPTVFSGISKAITDYHIPNSVRKGGMRVKFLKPTPAIFTVVRTDYGNTPTAEQQEVIDAATEINAELYLSSGTSIISVILQQYGGNDKLTIETALTDLALNSELNYTYTEDNGNIIVWSITKTTDVSSNYVHYILNHLEFTTAIGYWNEILNNEVLKTVYNGSCDNFFDMKEIQGQYFNSSGVLRLDNAKDRCVIFPADRYSRIYVQSKNAECTGCFLSYYDGVIATIVNNGDSIRFKINKYDIQKYVDIPKYVKYVAFNLQYADTTVEPSEVKLYTKEETSNKKYLSDIAYNGTCKSIEQMVKSNLYITSAGVLRKYAEQDFSYVIPAKGISKITIKARSDASEATGWFLSNFDGSSLTTIERWIISSGQSSTFSIPLGTKFIVVHSLFYFNGIKDITPEYVNFEYDWNVSLLSKYHNINYAYSARKRLLTQAEQTAVGLTPSTHNNNVSSFLQIAHVTDIHSDWVRAQAAFDVAGVLGAMLVNTGDNAVSYSADKAQYYTMVNNYEGDFLHCIGNHDAWGTTSQSDLYNTYIAPFKDTFGWTLSSSGATYYYKDDAIYKVRYIVLNQYMRYGESLGGIHYTQDQIDFLVSTLLDTPDNYGVIVVMHGLEVAPTMDNEYNKFYQKVSFGEFNLFSAGKIVYKIIDAFIAKTTISESVSGNGETLTLNADFSGMGNVEFICYLCGHTHRDYIHYAPECTNKQLILCCTCANAVYNSTGDELTEASDLARIPNTDTEFAFNVYTIDRERKCVKVVRIGSDVPFDMSEKRDYTEIPYKENV